MQQQKRFNPSAEVDLGQARSYQIDFEQARIIRVVVT